MKKTASLACAIYYYYVLPDPPEYAEYAVPYPVFYAPSGKFMVGG